MYKLPQQSFIFSKNVHVLNKNVSQSHQINPAHNTWEEELKKKKDLYEVNC